MQISDALANARLDAFETTLGTSAVLELFTGSAPASCASSDSGTKLWSQTGGSNWMNDAASRAKALAAAITGAAIAGGTAGHYRWKTSGGTCHAQGPVTTSTTLSTSASTSANGNVLTFTDTTGVSVGQNVTGTGIPTGATVVALTSTTVTLSHTSTAGVSSGASITFRGDIYLDNLSIANGQTVTVNSFGLTEP